jgi:SAM-dependent methyltransferase
MEPESRRKLITLYERSLERHGSTVRGVCWGTESCQQTRFRVLHEVGPWEGMSVADIGCGVGDFFGFLRDAGYRVEYTGYDISPKMVEAARLKYLDPSARFEVRDILDEGLPGPFDYVVASGTFNIRVNNHDAFMREMLALMYAQCRRAVAFNVLQPLSPSDPHYAEIKALCGDFYYDIGTEEMLAACRALCPQVALRDGYLARDATGLKYRDKDCTVFMYKEGQPVRADPPADAPTGRSEAVPPGPSAGGSASIPEAGPPSPDSAPRG